MSKTALFDALALAGRNKLLEPYEERIAELELRLDAADHAVDHWQMEAKERMVEIEELKKLMRRLFEIEEYNPSCDCDPEVTSEDPPDKYCDRCKTLAEVEKKEVGPV